MLNHIEALLMGIGASEHAFRGTALDADGRVRLVIRTRGWAEYLEVGMTEIRQYGAGSPQVCRRMRALLEDLRAGVLPARRAAVQEQLDALDRVTDAAFADPFQRALARMSDQQGLGNRTSRRDLRCPRLTRGCSEGRERSGRCGCGPPSSAS